MQALPDYQTMKTWAELVPGLHWDRIASSEAPGELVAPKSLIKVHYRAFIVQADQPARQIDSSFEGEFSSIPASSEPLSFVSGSNSVVKAWDHIFNHSDNHKGVHVGDKIQFLASSDLCYGPVGSPPKVPANAELAFQLVILSSSSRTKSPMEMAEKSTKLKEIGNKLFQNGAHQPASDAYTRALDNLRFIFPEEESEQEAINAIRLVCNLNRAACQLKLNLFAEAKHSCSDALYIDPSNVKALYRRAQASAATFDFDRAKRDLVAAIKLSPSDNTLRQELKNVQDKQIEYDKHSQAALAQFAKGAIGS